MQENLFIYERTPATSKKQFVRFWASRYHNDDGLYIPNIRGPHSATQLQALFRWKMGDRFFNHHLPRLKKDFFGRYEESRSVLKRLGGNDNRQVAEHFLNHFKKGGAIYRIFWLHCCDFQRFPIYDQHVHRAMVFIEDGEIEELPKLGPQTVVHHYLNRYLPFWESFHKNDARDVDRALWVFGKCLKNSSLPGL